MFKMFLGRKLRVCQVRIGEVEEKEFIFTLSRLRRGRWKDEGEEIFNTSPQLFVSSRKRQLFSPGAFHTNAADIQVKQGVSLSPSSKEKGGKDISRFSRPPPFFFESACSGAHTKNRTEPKQRRRRSCGFSSPSLVFFFNDH